jgi:molybdate transport system substrate-binding protein
VAKLTVMCARSMHLAVGALGREFSEASGHDLEFDFGTVGVLQARLDAGESADVLILSRPMIDRLAAAGALVGGSDRDVARTFIAVCIRSGAERPAISTADAFKATLERARAVAMSDPAVGGSAAVYVPTVFERLGIAALMKPKSLLEKNGVEVGRRVVEGKADFGLTLSGEVASVEGAEIAGPLPPPFGQETLYTAAVWNRSAAPEAGAAFIAALTGAAAASVWRKQGFELPQG